MKTMTCKQLGGVCDEKFQANTFEEIADLSQKHGAEMYTKGNQEHIDAMNEMKELMKNPEAMQAWMKDKKEKFNKL